MKASDALIERMIALTRKDIKQLSSGARLIENQFKRESIKHKPTNFDHLVAQYKINDMRAQAELFKIDLRIISMHAASQYDHNTDAIIENLKKGKATYKMSAEQAMVRLSDQVALALDQN